MLQMAKKLSGGVWGRIFFAIAANGTYIKRRRFDSTSLSTVDELITCRNQHNTPAGGLTRTGRWKQARGDGKFLFPVKALSLVFRARFVAALRRQFPGQEPTFYDALFKTPWVVYVKQAFGGPKQVVEYLGRYTHKIAISNHRIVSFSDGKVCFRYKDYRDESKTKIMTLDAPEFIRRFSLHILPKGFVRIRHYGILSSSRKQKTLPLIHQQLGSVYHKQETMRWKQIYSQHPSYDPDCCPVCKKQTMVTILVFDKRGPPQPELIQSRIRLQKLPPSI